MWKHSFSPTGYSKPYTEKLALDCPAQISIFKVLLFTRSSCSVLFFFSPLISGPHCSAILTGRFKNGQEISGLPRREWRRWKRVPRPRLCSPRPTSARKRSCSPGKRRGWLPSPAPPRVQRKSLSKLFPGWRRKWKQVIFKKSRLDCPTLSLWGGEKKKKELYKK